MRSVENSTKVQNLGSLYIQRICLLAKPLYLTLLITFVISFVLSACGSETKVGTVIGFGQSVPAGGGMVQSYSYVTMKLDDGTADAPFALSTK